jgi:hypothetical protein
VTRGNGGRRAAQKDPISLRPTRFLLRRS